MASTIIKITEVNLPNKPTNLATDAAGQKAYCTAMAKAAVTQLAKKGVTATVTCTLLTQPAGCIKFDAKVTDVSAEKLKKWCKGETG